MALRRPGADWERDDKPRRRSAGREAANPARREKMTDLLVLLVFLAMVLAPCFVAMSTQIPTGADLGVRDASEPRFSDSDVPFIPE